MAYLGAHAVEAPLCRLWYPLLQAKRTEVYLVVNFTLCSFSGLEVLPLKTVTDDIKTWLGATYYCRGTLFCSRPSGAVRRLKIGSLSN
jgi:hypothetical protein